MKSSKSIFIFLIIALAVPAGAYFLYKEFSERYQSLPVFGLQSSVKGNRESHRIEEFSLLNQDSILTGSEKWEGKIVVANFFFTHCPVVCPKMLQNMKRVQGSFGDEILLQSFSVDPERDLPYRLRRHINKNSISTNNWGFFTGDKKKIYRLARNSFMLVATDGDGGETDFIHSENLVLVDRDKRIRGYYNGTDKAEVDQLIKDIKKLQNEK